MNRAEAKPKPSIKRRIKRAFKKIKNNKAARISLLVLLGLVAALVLFRLIQLAFPVRSFEIEGDTKYDINEIIDASGIRTGDRLYWLDSSKAEKRLLKNCPYIESVEIERVFPKTIRFVIVEKTSGWYIEVGGDFYALNYDLTVLEDTDREERLKERGLTKLVLPELQRIVSGEHPTFGEGDEHLISETLKIIDTVRTSDIKNRLNYLDLSDRFHIKMIVDETFEVDFGDMVDSETKFDMIDEIIAVEQMKGYAGGVITVISPAEHSFRGYYAEDSGEDGKTSEN